MYLGIRGDMHIVFTFFPHQCKNAIILIEENRKKTEEEEETNKNLLDQITHLICPILIYIYIISHHYNYNTHTY